MRPSDLSNIHNAYLYAPIAKDNGLVLVTRFRAPTFPNTRPAPPLMPGGQLRYFSMCQNESQTQRFIACRTDDQTTVNGDGFLNYVVSTPGQRPANATAACGMTWLPWGPQSGGVLIYRNMLPDPSFAQAVQRVPAQGLEKQVMGDYFPVSRYYVDKSSFEKLGCAEAKTSSPVATAVCTDRTPPGSSISSRKLHSVSHDRKLRFRGRSIDFGCRGGPNLRSRGGRVKAVYVSVMKRDSGQCRFVKASGRLSGKRSCSNAILLPAHKHRGKTLGKTAWSLGLPRPLPVGSYEARVRGLDAAGNLESHRGNHTQVSFRVV